MNKNIEVAVIGAGLMGHGLALVHAMGGHKVKMQDISKEQLEAGVALIASALDTLVDAGVLEKNSVSGIIDRVEPVEHIADAVWL